MLKIWIRMILITTATILIRIMEVGDPNHDHHNDPHHDPHHYDPHHDHHHIPHHGDPHQNHGCG